MEHESTLQENQELQNEQTGAEMHQPTQEQESTPQNMESPVTETGNEKVETTEVITPLETTVPAVPVEAVAENVPAAEEVPVHSAEAPAMDASAPESSESAESKTQDHEKEGNRRSKKKSRMSDEEAKPIWDELRAIMESQQILTSEIIRSVNRGALIEYKGIEGFIPLSQFLFDGRAEQKDIDEMVGKPTSYVITELGDFEKRRFVCSRKKALKREKIQSLKKGAIVEGEVTSITSYGAFVDLGGIDGLIHISRLSKIRVSNPAEVVKLHDRIKVRIVDVNEHDERIALSMKEFTESPWTSVEEKYTVGGIYKGKVRNLTDFGAYIQLEPGIVGMIHITDLSWTKRVKHPSELVRVGNNIDVKIIDIKSQDRRIALSLKETIPDPWPRLANIYPPDTEASGKIKHLTESGAIVALDFDIDCFVPKGKMGGRRRSKDGKVTGPTYAVGDTVTVKVIEMDVDKHSFIASIVREVSDQPHTERRGEKSDYDMPKQSASDRNYTLGEVDGLKDLRDMFPSSEPATEELVSPALPAEPHVATPVEPTPAAVETAPAETPAVADPAVGTVEVTEPPVEAAPEAAIVEPATETTPVETAPEAPAADPETPPAVE